MCYATPSRPYTKEDARETEKLIRQARENERRSEEENERLHRLAGKNSRNDNRGN